MAFTLILSNDSNELVVVQVTHISISKCGEPYSNFIGPCCTYNDFVLETFFSSLSFSATILSVLSLYHFFLVTFASFSFFINVDALQILDYYCLIFHAFLNKSTNFWFQQPPIYDDPQASPLFWNYKSGYLPDCTYLKWFIAPHTYSLLLTFCAWLHLSAKSDPWKLSETLSPT